MFNNDINLLDITYDYLKSNVNKERTFEEICNHVLGLKGINKEEFNESLGSFYIEMLRDTRFIINFEYKWTLAETLTIAQKKQKINELYEFANSNEVKDDYDESESLLNTEQEIEEDDLFNASLEENNENNLDNKNIISDIDVDDEEDILDEE